MHLTRPETTGRANYALKKELLIRIRFSMEGSRGEVISNLGSFDENVFKIGMTRRLEPLERIYELIPGSSPGQA